MAGYKRPCRYCGKLVPPESNVCPLCGKVRPLGSLRCPKCQTPVQKDWKSCNVCGLGLEIACPKCSQATFFGDYCAACGARLAIVCPNPKCRAEQAPLGGACAKCGADLK